MERQATENPPHPSYRDDRRPGPNGLVSLNIAEQCRNLREAANAYDAFLADWAERHDDLQPPPEVITSQYRQSKLALQASIAATVCCRVTTMADLSLKAATLETCTQFCAECGLLADVTAGLLRDIQQVHAPVPASSSWRFPSLPLRTLWSGRQ